MSADQLVEAISVRTPRLPKLKMKCLERFQLSTAFHAGLSTPRLFFALPNIQTNQICAEHFLDFDTPASCHTEDGACLTSDPCSALIGRGVWVAPFRVMESDSNCPVTHMFFIFITPSCHRVPDLLLPKPPPYCYEELRPIVFHKSWYICAAGKLLFLFPNPMWSHVFSPQLVHCWTRNDKLDLSLYWPTN